MRVKQTALLVFTKTPVPGTVKTRLLSVLDAQQAAAIHAELLCFTLEVARRAAVSTVELWCTPTRRHPLLQGLARRFAVTLQTQSGADLGERMDAAMTRTLASHRQVLLVGSDCVDLSPEDINLALEQLAAGSEVALGPALDGGYYLIGLSKPQRRLFEGIDWGTDRVLQQTRARVAQLGLSLFELPPRRDLDRPEDLRYFRPHAPTGEVIARQAGFLPWARNP